MTITVGAVASNNNWQVLFNAVNTLAGLMTANVVTADGTANGSVTIGNTYFLGIFATSNLVANTVRGGNNAVSGPLYVSSNVVINTSSQLSVGNIVVNSSLLSVGNVSVNTTGIVVPNSVVIANVATLSTMNVAITNTSLQVIDSWSKSTIRSADYTLSIRDYTGNSYQTSKVMIVTDGASAYSTEFDVFSNSSVLMLVASTNATHVLLQAQTATSTNAAIKGVRTLINT